MASFGLSYVRALPWSSLFICAFVAGLSKGVLDGFHVVPLREGLLSAVFLLVRAGPSVCVFIAIATLPFAAEELSRGFVKLCLRWWAPFALGAATIGFLFGAQVYAVYGQPAL